MDRSELLLIQTWVKDELSRCVDFWLTNGIDREYGGVYTCLDRTGKIYSTDKSVWMQGRCGWTFSFLAKHYGPKPEYLAAAKSCIDFLEKYCVNREAGNRLYFTVTKDGRPLRQRRYCYSESFYSMANAEYYGLTGEREHLVRARAAYDMYYDLWHGKEDPTGLGPKTIPETRTGRNFGIPMIFLNMTAVLKAVDPERKALYEARAEECVHDIFAYHYHPELRAVLENVGPNGEACLDYSAGRIVNPGHSLEGVWFLLEYAKESGRTDLLPKCEEIFHWDMEKGWDKEYGGLLYFVDVLGCPPEAYEHDMKLWWPHDELLISSLMLYRETGKEEYLSWFKTCVSYVKERFSDPEYGEWYGYLRRDGLPTMPPCKGSTFKGPFHLPRTLAIVDKMIDEILA